MEQEIRKKTYFYGIAAVLLAITIGAVFCNLEGFQQLITPPKFTEGFLKKFSSEEELKNFLKTSSEGLSYDYYGMRETSRGFPMSVDKTLSPIIEYSTTNVQVAGVDELDIVKTNGTHMYIVSGSEVTMLKAYPAEEAEILFQLNFSGSIQGIFLNGNNKLAVLGESHDNLYSAPYVINDKTFVYVYDVSTGHPVSARNFSITGAYCNSRMINEYLYLVVNEPIYWIHDTLILPKIYSGNKVKEIKATEIYYTWVNDYFSTTTIIAINIQNDDQEPTYLPILRGLSSCMYVSLNNLYITYAQRSIKTPNAPAKEETEIFRIHLEGEKVECKAKGNVSGHVLNQFSMDEYNGYFRIATTTQIDITEHHIFVLNMSLAVVGKINNIGHRETLYVVRFIGTRGYVVTFRQVDPLFVIDLTDPYNPQLKGELTIPGYSSYLHSMDENHIIGVGKENRSVKLSLFDVSDARNPKETSKYVINNGWHSDSPALNDHKAFLFDKKKCLLVIPIRIEGHFVTTPEGWKQYSFWQGAYVFHLTPSEGFIFKGGVTHGLQYGENVKRSLYVNNVLYTISEAKVKMNNLNDLTDINEVTLS